MSLHDTVKELALSLPDGCSTRDIACPTCGSASSFSVTREEGVLKFICFKVTCGIKGVVGSRSTSEYVAPVKQVKLFTDRLFKLELGHLTWLQDLFKLHNCLLHNIKWSYSDKRVYYPQYNIKGVLQGYIARHYPELAGMPTRGAKAYWKPVVQDAKGLCIPNINVLHMIQQQERVVLVEDYPSCLRIISQLELPCCCLGGTNLYDSMIDTLMELEVKQVVVVLDADAISKALKMKRKLQLAFPNTLFIPLIGGDPKDCTEAELTNIFNHIEENYYGAP